MMKSFKLYDRVALTNDLVDTGLRVGDIATIVDTVPHPKGGLEGVVLEVTNALGESLRVVVVTENDIEPLHANEIFSVRQLV